MKRSIGEIEVKDSKKDLYYLYITYASTIHSDVLGIIIWKRKQFSEEVGNSLALPWSPSKLNIQRIVDIDARGLVCVRRTIELRFVLVTA